MEGNLAQSHYKGKYSDKYDATFYNNNDRK